jgi:hypothetical protein
MKTCYAICVTSLSLSQDYFERHQCDRLELLDLSEGMGPTSYHFKEICVKRRNLTTTTQQQAWSYKGQSTALIEQEIMNAIIYADADFHRG